MSGSIMLSSSRHSFHTCVSIALMSVNAVAHTVSIASSDAMLSGEDASACILLGVDERATFGDKAS